jgi:hypothetical protein
MAKIRGIALCFFIFFLTMAGWHTAWQDNSFGWQDGLTHISAHQGAFQHPIVTKCVKKDRLKVRFMGGECSYDASAIPVIVSVPVFGREIAVCEYRSFISDDRYLSFKLRGPPASIA